MSAVVVSLVIFGITLIIVFSEKINRTIVAMAGAVAMVAAGLLFGFYSEHQALEAIDFETIGLLAGMMVMVALLEPTGFFQYLAVQTARLSRGRPARLLLLLGAVTTVLSMFLDNVTTVVLIAPVTILIGEILGISPAPLLITEALLSNTGGIATLVGDPPNVLIASAADLTFNDFLTHALPIVLVAWLAALLLLRILFRRELKETQVDREAVLRLNPAQALNDGRTACKVMVILGFIILGFFLQKPLGVSPAFIALLGAAVASVWVRPDIQKTLAHVEWSVLVFFAGLFVLVGGLEAAGVLETVAHWIVSFSREQTLLMGVAMLWMVAILSAVVDNIPITIALIPVILSLGADGVDIGPLWWALAFGAGLGGNGTIIGSTANVVVVSLSERTRAPITSVLWSKRGLPVMFLTLAITTGLYILAYPLYVR
ncbi:MAG: ArsB/NhaD family transporter [Anaerolineales bacterium]|nr:ArsB/NhaD family transporter [Anaerolineales bacterium]